MCGLRVLFNSMFHVSQFCIQLSPSLWQHLSISEFKDGKGEDSPHPSIPCKNPKPRYVPSPPFPQLYAQKMPSLGPVSTLLLPASFEGCQTTTPRVLLDPEEVGLPSSAPPYLIPLAFLFSPSQVRGCQPAHTQRLYPEQRGVKLYTVSRANTPPRLPALAFPKDRGQCTQGLSQNNLSAISCPLLQEVSPDLAACSQTLWQLCPIELSTMMELFYTRTVTVATDDYGAFEMQPV